MIIMPKLVTATTFEIPSTARLLVSGIRTTCLAERLSRGIDVP